MSSVTSSGEILPAKASSESTQGEISSWDDPRIAFLVLTVLVFVAYAAAIGYFYHMLRDPYMLWHIGFLLVFAFIAFILYAAETDIGWLGFSLGVLLAFIYQFLIKPSRKEIKRNKYRND